MLSDPQQGNQTPSSIQPEPDPSELTIYQIRLAGHLGPEWTDWFEGMALRLEEDGDTVLTGAVTDQAALHGLLKKVRDLGMPLVSLNQVRSEEQLRDREERSKDSLS